MNEPDLSAMDPQARRFLAMVALGSRETSHGSVEARRRSFEKLMRFSKAPPGRVAARDDRIPSVAGGIPIRCYAPVAAAAVLPALIYFHGGGLVAGSIDTHDALCRTLAHEAGCRVLSVGYRLAPEHPFPAGLVDALLATRWIQRHVEDLGIAGDKLAVGGDSGGGTLAAVVCQVMRRSIRLRAQVLLCPVLDFAVVRPSRDAYARGFLLDSATMVRDLADYAAKRDLADPRISPLCAPSLAGLPRAVIHTAGFDPLRDEGDAYATALCRAGVRVDHTCHDALIHHFYALTGAVPAAATALSAIAVDLRDALF